MNARSKSLSLEESAFQEPRGINREQVLQHDGLTAVNVPVSSQCHEAPVCTMPLTTVVWRLVSVCIQTSTSFDFGSIKRKH